MYKNVICIADSQNTDISAKFYGTMFEINECFFSSQRRWMNIHLYLSQYSFLESMEIGLRTRYQSCLCVCEWHKSYLSFNLCVKRTADVRVYVYVISRVTNWVSLIPQKPIKTNTVEQVSMKFSYDPFTNNLLIEHCQS